MSVFLHCCCAVCACSIIERLAPDGLVLFFYNPNIHPYDEYLRRKEELVRYARQCGVPCVDADYDSELWMQTMRGLELEPERGKRCCECFRMRLLATAKRADQLGYTSIATTLGISRWKNLVDVNEAGKWAVSHISGMQFIDQNWRKQGGVTRMTEISRQENFYRQTYCGCLYSQRKQNAFSAL